MTGRLRLSDILDAAVEFRRTFAHRAIAWWNAAEPAESMPPRSARRDPVASGGNASTHLQGSPSRTRGRAPIAIFRGTPEPSAAAGRLLRFRARAPTAAPSLRSAPATASLISATPRLGVMLPTRAGHATRRCTANHRRTAQTPAGAVVMATARAKLRDMTRLGSHGAYVMVTAAAPRPRQILAPMNGGSGSACRWLKPAGRLRAFGEPRRAIEELKWQTRAAEASSPAGGATTIAFSWERSDPRDEIGEIVLRACPRHDIPGVAALQVRRRNLFGRSRRDAITASSWSGVEESAAPACCTCHTSMEQVAGRPTS